MSSYINLLTNDIRIGVCVKKEKCALNKEILDLLNEESISGACSGRASL